MDLNKQYFDLAESLWKGVEEKPRFSSFPSVLAEVFKSEQVCWAVLGSRGAADHTRLVTTPHGPLSKAAREILFTGDWLHGTIDTAFAVRGSPREASISHLLHTNGWSDVLSLNVALPVSRQLAVRIIRGAQQPAFGDRDADLLSALAGQLKLALQLHERLSELELTGALYERLVKDMGLGEVRLDGTGRVTYTNSVAEQLLAREKPLAVKDERLYCPDPRNHVRLESELDKGRAGGNELRSVYLLTHSISEVVGLHVRSLPREEVETIGDGSVKAAYIVTPGQDSTLSVALVEKLFDLTAAQARVAVLLAEGLSPGEIADQLSVSRNTVRTHIQHIYAKTGVNRQSALANLLVRSMGVVWSVGSLQS